ncbi:hypothetical protein [Mycolicibacterium porcinum]|uniref:hypothetical protein n=1 Tax=Mycolicibacterium porcinum TaxID=39693 RepID=UPI000B0B8038|nr:hypothetical protein [Mycolicibacterium porcinum]
MTSITAIRRLAALMTAAVLVVSGCTPPEPAPQLLARWPKGFEDFAFVWSSEPGIDLTVGPAVVARAYLESYQLAYMTADNAYLYPGFAEAVEQPLRPNSRDSGKPWVGAQRNHILSITRTDRAVTVVGCTYTYAVGTQTAGGEYSPQDYPSGGKDAGIFPMGVVMLAPSEPGEDAPQLGPARSPSDDVFGGFQITGRSRNFFSAGAGDTSSMPPFEQVRDTCVAKAPDPLERREFFIGKFHPRADFPVQPAHPGWPANPAEHS